MKTWPRNMAVRVFLALSALACLAGEGFGQQLSEYGNPLVRLKIKGVPVTAEVVSSPERLYLGLSHRRELPEGRGMLFLMGSRDRHVFCMRDMHFGLDIIWIADGRVAGLHKNLSPQDQDGFRPPVPVSFVLEVPAGFADRHGLKEGDRVEGIPGESSP